MQQQI
jgi:serine/threonine protein kinase